MSTDKKLILDKESILEYQKNRDPFLMIDYATEVIPGKSSIGFKDLKTDEWFFEVHWPGDPNMPGVLQIESIIQMASLSILTLPNNKSKLMYIHSVEKVMFKKKILPGERLDIETNVLNWKRGIGKFQGSAFVNKKPACEAIFTLILPDEFYKYSVRNK
tara:strand:- start:201 stop:677 length:477 start_codon:yes stop_codon:yes gene_type:complete